MVIFLTYEEAVDYILQIPKFTKKNTPSHTREFMNRLGNPQNDFEVIHVAGSNGKGSVCAFINSVCLESQIHVGMFTSPHLADIRERFLLDGMPCSKDVFLDAMQKVQTVIKDMEADGLAHPTFFEFLFGMGMLIFQNAKVSCVILETGLGGRLDATNVVEHPLLTVITSISLEHTEILGDSIEEIAREKAGIIKPGVPVIFDANEPEAEKVILQVAKELKAPAEGISRESIKILLKEGKNIDFSIDSEYDVTRVGISFPADYQVMNGALALAAVNRLKNRFYMSREDIERGFRNARWPGRMEEICPEVYLDGAHNVAGIKVFLTAVKTIGGKDASLLFSMVQEKDYRQAIRILCREGDFGRIILTEISNNPRAIKADHLERIFREETEQPIELITITDPKEAFLYAMKTRKIGQKLFCAGSLYLIGELRQIAGGLKDD